MQPEPTAPPRRLELLNETLRKFLRRGAEANVSKLLARTRPEDYEAFGFGVDLTPDGLDTRRIDKTITIAGWPLAMTNLRVCWENRRGALNCGDCEKCLRTLVGLRLAGIAGTSWAGGLAALMAGDDAEAGALLLRAADEYRVSWEAAPPGSWGRPIAMLRCRLMAGDRAGARADAGAALAAGVLEAAGPIGGYCAALALLVVGRDDEAGQIAGRIEAEGLQPVAVAQALGAIAGGDAAGFEDARRAVLTSFETRDAFLEDVPVADTVLVLDALARARALSPVRLESPLLPRGERRSES